MKGFRCRSRLLKDPRIQGKLSAEHSPAHLVVAKRENGLAVRASNQSFEAHVALTAYSP